MNNPNQKLILIIASVIVCTVIGFYIYKTVQDKNLFEYSDLEDAVTQDDEESGAQEGQSKIIIHMTGAVQNQGIVKLPEGSRIIDAIEQAGGITGDADTTVVNLAYMLEDGQKVYIPTINEREKELEYVTGDSGENVIQDSSWGTAAKISVNINTATQTMLEQIPGVGPSTAAKIIEYRKENGKFTSIEDIKEVSGIGEAKYESMKDYITVK